jgi:hypothetical protein
MKPSQDQKFVKYVQDGERQLSVLSGLTGTYAERQDRGRNRTPEYITQVFAIEWLERSPNSPFPGGS